MVDFLRRTYCVNFTKTFTILRKDGRRLFSSYKLTRTIEEVEKLPDIGDTVTIYGKHLGLNQTLGVVEKRQIYLDPKKSKFEKIFTSNLTRPDYVISLKPVEEKIYGDTFNDLELDDIFDLWIHLFYHHVTLNEFRFERELGKSDWELWDGWFEVFVEHNLFPFNDFGSPPFRWTPESMGFGKDVTN